MSNRLADNPRESGEIGAVKRIGEWFTRFWPFVLPVVIYLPGILGRVPFPSKVADSSDLLLTHYPYAHFIKTSLLQDQVIPLWMPHLLSGSPFAANPLSGLWYPGGWPALVLPLPEGLTIMAAVHIVWGEIGLYRYLRTIGLSHREALLGGLIFGFLPKFASHYGAGHLTLLYAVSWTPWLILAAEDQRGWYLEGAILALIFLADPRWIIYGGAIWAGYKFTHRDRAWPEFLLQLTKTGGFAVLGAGPLWIPFWEFLARSSRTGLTPEDVLAHSVQPAGALGLFFPKGGGNPEWELYLGALGLLAGFLGWTTAEKSRTYWFWLTAMLVSLIWSFGDSIPLMKLMAQIPVLNLLRVPPRAVFITGLSAAVGSACTARALREGNTNVKAFRLGLAGLTAAGVISILGLLVLLQQLELKFLIGLFFLIGACILLYWAQSGGRDWRIFMTLAAVLVAGDGIAAGLINYHPRKISTIDDRFKPVFQMVQGGDDFYRVYSPSAGIPQHFAVREELDLAHGVDPMQLESYRKAFLEAAGVADQGYDVSVPPYYGEDPSSVHDGAEISPELMGLFNVLYIESAFKVEDHPQFSFLGTVGSRWVYENQAYRSRAWTTPELGVIDQDLEKLLDVENAAARIVKHSPNLIKVQAEGPGYLVLSEMSYPGWIATSDGKNIPVETAGTVFRAVPLEQGEQTVTFSYRPLSVAAGVSLGVLAVGLFLVCRRRHGPAP